LLGVVAMAASYGLIMVWQVLVWYFWPEFMDDMNENVDRLLALVPKAHPLTFGALALAVGLYEELIFRGFIMPRLRRATQSWVIAVVLSTALFTLPHLLEQTVSALIPITILSVVFSLVTIWRKSVVPAIIGHFLFNWSQFVGLYVVGGDNWT
jgi:membrane protease YdiL (CAAX protease family)